MSEKDVEQLIKRKDKLNTQIELLQKQNKEREELINKLILELKQKGVDVELNTIDTVLSKYEDIYNKEYSELKLMVDKTEMELMKNGL